MTFLTGTLFLSAQKINRRELVKRHDIIVTKADSLSSLTIGNGRFAFTTDITGLQTFTREYEKGVSLGTQSEWGWHSFIDTVGYKIEEAYKTFHLNGRDITYTTQWNAPPRNKAVSDWFRQNPHRLQLGNLGFELLKKNGELAGITDIHDIRQRLNLWTGEISSHFSIEGETVDVSTFCHQEKDLVSVHVRSALIAKGRLKIRILFPYPTGAWTDEGTNRGSENKHQSGILVNQPNGTVLLHQLDTTKYYVGMQWSSAAVVSEKSKHYFIITPALAQIDFKISIQFSDKQQTGALPIYEQVKTSSETGWKNFWNSGGAIDFAGSTDTRANELERRIILSQYLLRAQEAGSYPPQETGLTYNSWFGKPHLEMHWWHAAHYALWGRTEILEKGLDWYKTIATKAKAIATRQGFDGIRWQKMTDNNGDEAPSSIGALLIWQQPHFIYFAELCYRNKKNKATLDKYKELVFATADFMASFPYYDSARKQYNLGKGMIPAQERFKAEEAFNPGFELVYWHWALDMAQQWRQRLNLPRNKNWDTILAKLAPLPVQEGKYLFTEIATDSYTNPEFKTDHPAILGALGMMPETGQVNRQIMQHTFDWIWTNWSWNKTWGWDFPLTAMTTTRLAMPDKTIDALLMNITTNRYLVNGHNYQDERLRIYLPGNGGLLTAAAMMCAGYDGSTIKEPGIPKNGKWKVQWEGLNSMP